MLTIYAPSDKPNSKCWEVFKGIQKTWKEPIKIADNSLTYFLNDDSQSMFWGLVNNNTNLIHQIEESGQTWWFTDTPYFGRFDNNNLQPDNHYWRICKNNIHVPYIKNLDNKRLKNFNINVKDKRTKGDYILVCPSSAGIHGFINELDWLENTISKIKKFTDRPIVVREKPRGRGTSGPSEASVHIKDQLSNSAKKHSKVAKMSTDSSNLHKKQVDQIDDLIDEKTDYSKEKKSGLHGWFSRQGGKGKSKGWVDCNAPDGKGGYKSCGRGSGEKRKKYPACRPTPGACKERGKGKSWGKKGSKRKKK